MTICGVICEYNPFHNGHAYLLRALRDQTGCDWVVCVMSGAFTQRGEAAIVSKWARAEMALRCGADAVFELPCVYAVRDAQRFAQGGVALLGALGAVTHLGFGSESGDLAALSALAGAGDNLPAIRGGLAQGMTLARARGEAMGQAAGAPNDTLAIEYLRAISALRSPLTPVTIRRAGGGYHDTALGAMASATAIRAALARGEDVFGSMPAPAYALLGRLLQAGAVQRPDGLDTVLLAMLRTMTPQALNAIADVGEGLENRMLRAAMEATSREALLSLSKCKRYTWARLSRIAAQAMLGITKRVALETSVPAYARLLGFRRAAQPLMAALRAQAQIPIITRAARLRDSGDPAFAIDLRAGDLWALGLSSEALRAGHADLTHSVVIID